MMLLDRKERLSLGLVKKYTKEVHSFTHNDFYRYEREEYDCCGFSSHVLDSRFFNTCPDYLLSFLPEVVLSGFKKIVDERLVLSITEFKSRTPDLDNILEEHLCSLMNTKYTLSEKYVVFVAMSCFSRTFRFDHLGDFMSLITYFHNERLKISDFGEKLKDLAKFRGETNDYEF